MNNKEVYDNGRTFSVTTTSSHAGVNKNSKKKSTSPTITTRTKAHYQQIKQQKLPNRVVTGTFRGLSSSPQPQPKSGLTQKDNYDVCPAYKDLFISQLGRAMRQIGKQQASLSLIGYFLSCAGNHLLSYIYNAYKKRVFYPYHKVLGIQQLSNGDYAASVQRIIMDKRGSSKNIIFTAKAIVLAIGGQQKIPQSLDFKTGLSKDKIVFGEDVLKREGYIKLLKKIQKQKPKSIIIVGGSHTGFSVAWLLLNGPVDYI